VWLGLAVVLGMVENLGPTADTFGWRSGAQLL
jgi:hypothetical protein